MGSSNCSSSSYSVPTAIPGQIDMSGGVTSQGEDAMSASAKRLRRARGIASTMRSGNTVYSSAMPSSSLGSKTKLGD